MAWRDERPDVQLHLPLQPAITPTGRDQERRDPPVSGRYRGLFASGVRHPPRLQDLESADSTKVATCAAFAVLPPSDFPSRQPRRSNADVAIPFSIPMLVKHRSQLNKVCCSRATNSSLHDLTRWSELCRMTWRARISHA